MFSLIASVRPAPAAGPSVLRYASARLRARGYVLCGPGQLLVTLPQIGTALVTESRTLLRIDVVVTSEDAAARACAALVTEIDSTDAVISWVRDDHRASAQG